MCWPLESRPAALLLTPRVFRKLLLELFDVEASPFRRRCFSACGLHRLLLAFMARIEGLKLVFEPFPDSRINSVGSPGCGALGFLWSVCGGCVQLGRSEE